MSCAVILIPAAKADVAESAARLIAASRLPMIFVGGGAQAQNTATGTISDGSNIFDAPNGFSPFGINGGYYYVRANYSF